MVGGPWIGCGSGHVHRSVNAKKYYCRIKQNSRDSQIVTGRVAERLKARVCKTLGEIPHRFKSDLVLFTGDSYEKSNICVRQ